MPLQLGGVLTVQAAHLQETTETPFGDELIDNE